MKYDINTVTYEERAAIMVQAMPRNSWPIEAINMVTDRCNLAGMCGDVIWDELEHYASTVENLPSKRTVEAEFNSVINEIQKNLLEETYQNKYELIEDLRLAVNSLSEWQKASKRRVSDACDAWQQLRAAIKAKNSSK